MSLSAANSPLRDEVGAEKHGSLNNGHFLVERAQSQGDIKEMPLRRAATSGEANDADIEKISEVSVPLPCRWAAYVAL